MASITISPFKRLILKAQQLPARITAAFGQGFAAQDRGGSLEVGLQEGLVFLSGMSLYSLESVTYVTCVTQVT